MIKQTEIRFNLKGLEEIAQEVGNRYRTRVGVLGDNAERKDEDSGLNNAELLLIQMFGSLVNNIPPRDPLLIPIEKHRREILQKLATGDMRAAFERKDYHKMFELLGAVALEIVDNAFVTSGDGSWPPNAPATIAAKGSSMPLIDTSQLRRAMTSDVIKKGGEPIKSAPVVGTL